MLREAWVSGTRFRKQDLGRAAADVPTEVSPVKVHAGSLALQLEELSEPEGSPVEPTRRRARACGPLIYSC